MRRFAAPLLALYLLRYKLLANSGYRSVGVRDDGAGAGGAGDGYAGGEGGRGGAGVQRSGRGEHALIPGSLDETRQLRRRRRRGLVVRGLRGLLLGAVGRPGEAHLLVAEIEHGVVGAHEDVAEDPEVAHAGGEVEAHEARDALLGAALVYLENVLLGCEREDLAGKGNVDVGHGGEVVAVDRRLAAGARDLGAGLVQRFVDGRLGLIFADDLLDFAHQRLAQEAVGTGALPQLLAHRRRVKPRLDLFLEHRLVHVNHLIALGLKNPNGTDLLVEIGDRVGSVPPNVSSPSSPWRLR